MLRRNMLHKADTLNSPEATIASMQSDTGSIRWLAQERKDSSEHVAVSVLEC